MRLRSTTALLACVVLVAACSGNSKPQVLPTLTSTPTATAAPAVPLAAAVRTARGADAFVHFFFQNLNAAFSTSNPAMIRALRNAECETCNTYEASLGAARAGGQRIEGESFVLETVAAAPLQSQGTLVDVTGHVPARRLVDTSGGPLRLLPANGSFHFTVAVKWIGGRWLVSAIGRAPGK